MFCLLVNAERKFLTLCSFCPPSLLPIPASSLAVILLSVSEKHGAIQSDILPSCSPLPPHAHASLRPVPSTHQPHAHPAGARGPVSQQALLLLLFFLLPSMLRCLLPSILTHLPAFPLLPREPCLPSMLPSTFPAALLAHQGSATTNSLTSLPCHDGSSDQLRLRGHPGFRGHGVPCHGAPVCPLPHTSSPASADNDEPTCKQ